METTWLANGFISQALEPLEPFFLSRPRAGLPTGLSFVLLWSGGLPFFPIARSCFLKESCPIWRLWWMTVMDPLAKSLGQCDKPRRNKRLHLRMRGHFLPPLASLTSPAQNLVPLGGEDLETAQSHAVKKSEAGTLYIHLFQVTSAQESLVGRFQLKWKWTTN